MFNSNEYAPQTVHGRRLLAHELTHVVQQSQEINGKHQTEEYSNSTIINRKKYGGEASINFLDAIKKMFDPPPKLIANPSRSVQGNCGEIRWETGWELSKYGRGGFVIQEVDWKETLTRDCFQPSWTDEHTTHYFEAWRITKNGKFPSDDDAINDTFGRSRPHEAAKGRIEINATAQYHDNLPENSLPTHMVRDNKDTNAHKLRSSLSNPNLGGDISKAIPHNLIIEWDCCDHNNANLRVRRPTQVISRTP